MSIATEPAEATPDGYVVALLIEGVKERGGQYLRMLGDWIGEAETLQ
jgi:hypothetical protein